MYRCWKPYLGVAWGTGQVPGVGHRLFPSTAAVGEMEIAGN